MLKLFDREDGHAADWPLIAETLLREAFLALDQAPTDPRAALLLRGFIPTPMTACPQIHPRPLRR
jgi:hypothetical protein